MRRERDNERNVRLRCAVSDRRAMGSMLSTVLLLFVANAELLQLDVDVRLNADLLRVALEGGEG